MFANSGELVKTRQEIQASFALEDVFIAGEFYGKVIDVTTNIQYAQLIKKPCFKNYFDFSKYFGMLLESCREFYLEGKPTPNFSS